VALALLYATAGMNGRASSSIGAFSELPGAGLVGPSCQQCALERTAGRNYCGACGNLLRPRCERKQVTVLIADVSGFTTLSAQLDPEQVSEIMAPHLRCGARGRARGMAGTVNQFLGDGVMALFDEDRLEHHAGPSPRCRACDPGAHRDRTPRGTPELRSRVSDFASASTRGPVVIGTIGAALRSDYTATGATASAALGLLQIAEPGQIVVTERTRALAAGRHGFAEFGAIPLTESGETAVVYELSGHGAPYTGGAVLAAA
jgi:class 3 adenylate cyclase